MNPAHTATNPASGPNARNAQIPPNTAILNDNAVSLDIVLSRLWLFKFSQTDHQIVTACPVSSFRTDSSQKSITK